MSYLVDTNVLLRLVQPNNPQQPDARRAFRILRRREPLVIIPQNLIEFWAVATRLVVYNGLGLSIDETAKQVNGLKSLFSLFADDPNIFAEWERIVLQYQVAGKQVHDARLVAAMKVHGLSNLLTFNDADFKRFTEIVVVNPQSVA